MVPRDSSSLSGTIFFQNRRDKMTFFELVKDIAGDEQVVADLINNGNITFYWGTDPTSSSLHIGHYSSLVTAKRLYKYGHKPILLVGGATGLIGDPKPGSEREIISYERLNSNLEGIKKQVSKIFNNEVLVVNNYDWIKEFDYINFLRDVGKYINVNYLLDKDIIRRRLETGITYAEFSYNLIQGYDFLHLYEKHNCLFQIEGSDQWGNITTGIDLIKKKLGKEAYAFTMPLVLDSNGQKFGKSEGNALWLDLNKTSSYKLYQYLLNSDDNIVESYLKIFTFLSLDEIKDIMIKHNREPHLRLAQKTLASEFVRDLHGEEELQKALKLSEILFTGKFINLSKEDIEEIFDKNMIIDVDNNIPLIDLLIQMQIASSKREAKEFITGNSISINGEKITDLEYNIDDNNFIDNTYIIIKKGKKNYYIGRKK